MRVLKLGSSIAMLRNSRVASPVFFSTPNLSARRRGRQPRKRYNRDLGICPVRALARGRVGKPERAATAAAFRL